MSFCLSTCMDNLLAMNRTKYLIRPTIMIITITKIKNKTRKWHLSLIINYLTHVSVSGVNFFFVLICSYFIKQNFLEWFKILKSLRITWAVEQHCLEISVILIQYEFLTLKWNVDKTGMRYKRHLSAASTFS